MANKLYEENDIQNIANAIRGKNGTSDKYMVSQMASAIANLQLNSSDGTGITPSGTINITTNGTHDVTNYASANVNISNDDSELPSNIRFGTFEFSDDNTTSCTITHNIGVIPYMMFLSIDDFSVAERYNILSVCTQNIYHVVKNSANEATYKSGIVEYSVSDTELTCTVANAAYQFKTGTTYHWFAWI